MRKQFDLEYYKENPNTKVVTRLGSEVSSIKEMEDGGIWVTVKLGGKRELSFTSAKNGLSGWDGEKDPLDLFFDLPDPEKKRVPLTYEDLLERIKDGKTMWIIDDRDTVFNIVDFDFEAAYYIHGEAKEVLPASYEDLIDGITFADGTPCWKEVDSE